MTYIHTTSNSFGWVSINTRASARFGSTFEHATEPLNFIFLLQASTDTEKGANDYNKHYDARHYAQLLEEREAGTHISTIQTNVCSINMYLVFQSTLCIFMPFLSLGITKGFSRKFSITKCHILRYK